MPIKFFEDAFPDDVRQSQPEKPDILNNESLKFCCQLDIREDQLDVSPSESTASQDTKNFFPKGNIGWFGSTCSQTKIPQKYLLQSSTET